VFISPLGASKMDQKAKREMEKENSWQYWIQEQIAPRIESAHECKEIRAQSTSKNTKLLAVERGGKSAYLSSRGFGNQNKIFPAEEIGGYNGGRR
jgi:hypothetical protein